MWEAIAAAVLTAGILGIAAIVRKALSKRYHSPVDKLGEEIGALKAMVAAKVDAVAGKVDDLAGGVNRQLFGHMVVCDCLKTVIINQIEGRANGTTEDSLKAICKESETHREFLEGRK